MVEIVGGCESCGQIDPSDNHGNKGIMLSFGSYTFILSFFEVNMKSTLFSESYYH